MNSIESFLAAWDREADKTIQMLKTLPAGQYDFRPDSSGRSLGELAWHLAEVDAYVSLGIETGVFPPETKPPNIQRPMTIEELGPGYERIHQEARERLKGMAPDDLEKEITFLDGSKRKISFLLWDVILFHTIHHRGQLSVLVRLAGGVVPSLFGPTREQARPIARK